MTVDMENDSSKYLVELEHAEHNILSRLHAFILNISDFMVSLGIYPRHSWYLIELPKEQLVPSIKGEIDILAGNFEFSDPDELERFIKSFAEENRALLRKRTIGCSVIIIVDHNFAI
jgi:hypothetical protein